MATTTQAPEPPLTHDQRLRRCMILCCAVARNLAYHRARRDGGGLARAGEDFWNTADGNCIDMAVLAWCELFGFPRAEQGWRGMVTDQAVFEAGLLLALGVTADEFAALIGACRHYRDKFLAHLDSDRTMLVPQMDLALQATRFLYDHIWASEIDPIWRDDAPPDLHQVYRRALAEGVRVYEA